MAGIVHGVYIKPRRANERGLPKSLVESVRLSSHGAEGDYNRYRTERLKGDPDQAVLVMPMETILALNEEFWPVKPGDLGENITTAEIEYESFAPGSRWRFGDSELVITKACEPCRNLYKLSYVDAIYGPEFLKTLVDRRGWYARVTEPGTVSVGDSIEAL